MHTTPWLPACLLVLSFYLVTAQIPAFGGCPKYDAMPMFNKTRFLGLWYEAERYFTVTELASKCIAVTYETRPDGKIWVNNAITNRL
jgi:apolipoprotein D and lipocalin family protein